MAIFDDCKDNQTRSGIFDDRKLNSKKIIIDEDDLDGFEHIDNYLKNNHECSATNTIYLSDGIWISEDECWW